MIQETLHRKSRKLITGGVMLICLLIIMMHQTSLAYTGTPIATTNLATPALDPTGIALQRSVLENQKLTVEITKLHHDIQPSIWDIFLTNFPVIVGAIVGLIGIGRWIADRQDARQKSLDERFQSAIQGLGSEHEEARVQAVAILINFLQPGYKQFYKQIFDLSVVNLGLQRPELPVNIQEAASKPLFQSLVRLFKDSLPLARETTISKPLFRLPTRFFRTINSTTRAVSHQQNISRLDARFTYLGYASLASTDLQEVNLQSAYLQQADLEGANLQGADLRGADLQAAYLVGANLHGVRNV